MTQEFSTIPKPNGFPYQSDMEYRLTGRLLNELVTLLYNMEASAGNIYKGDHGGLYIELPEALTPGHVKIVSEIEDSLGTLEGRYYEAKLYLGGYVENPEGADFDAIVRSVGDESLIEGQVYLGVPVIQTIPQVAAVAFFPELAGETFANVEQVIYHVGGGSSVSIAVVLADTAKADIYRGEGAGEGGNEKKIAENVDYELRSDFAAVEGQRLLAIKVRGVWECYMVVDGVVNGRTAATLQSLTVKEDNSLEWKDELPDGSHPGDILVWEEDEPVGENPPEGRWVNLGINPTAGNILHYTTGDTWELLSNPPSQSVLVHDGDNHISWMEVEEFECPTEEEEEGEEE